MLSNTRGKLKKNVNEGAKNNPAAFKEHFLLKNHFLNLPAARIHSHYIFLMPFVISK